MHMSAVRQIRVQFLPSTPTSARQEGYSEMEVTELILAKVLRLFFVSYRVTVMGFFLGYIFLNPQGLAYAFLWRTKHHHPMIHKCF
jgi:hypothetical protein